MRSYRPAYEGFIHFYNHHRTHGALGWTTLTSILKDNLQETIEVAEAIVCSVTKLTMKRHEMTVDFATADRDAGGWPTGLAVFAALFTETSQNVLDTMPLPLR